MIAHLQTFRIINPDVCQSLDHQHLMALQWISQAPRLLSLRKASSTPLIAKHVALPYTTSSGTSDETAHGWSPLRTPKSDQVNSTAIATDQSTNAEDNVKKTLAQLDEELRMKMSGIAGDGGEAGIELEDGQPTSMKRSVRENMFRYI